MKFNFFNGADGEQSSKRLFTAVMMALWVVYFFVNLFTGRQLKATLEEYLFYMILAAYGGIVLEMWAKRKSPPPDKTESTVTKETETTVIKKTDG